MTIKERPFWTVFGPDTEPREFMDIEEAEDYFEILANETPKGEIIMTESQIVAKYRKV